MNNIFLKRKRREKEKQELLKKVKRAMVIYWEINEINRVSMGITNVDAVEKKDIVEVTVTLERPGLLIGKAGRHINALKECIEEYIEKDVKILIVEGKMWMNLY